MRIYADSSFLVSCLYWPDPGHPAAKAFFLKRATDEWLTSSWSQFETTNSLRQLSRSKPGPSPALAEALRRLFKYWHEAGSFSFEETDANQAIVEAAQISAALGTRHRVRAADLLHVALLEQITPDLFVTRDKDQHLLARALAFNSHFVP
ncbi:MAG: PIN domain-containing protein [Limisphaerales bacterium]